MAQLTNIEWKKYLATITFDDGNQFYITRDIFYELNLKENELYDLEQLKKKIILFQYRSALNKAVSILALRPCSIKEIEDRLLRFHYLSDTIDLVIYKLKKEGFLNDQEFAKQWTESRMNQGKYGRTRIAYELRRKGLSENTVDEVMNETDPEQEFCSAYRLAEKSLKSVSSCDDILKQKRRIYGMLARRGFETDIIHQVIDQIFSDE